jgi:hypothetical protein
MIGPGIWIPLGAALVVAATLGSAALVTSRQLRSPAKRARWRAPKGANGWQLCMGLYGIAYGAGLLWPGLVGASSTWRLLTGMRIDPVLLGWAALGHGSASIVAVFFFGGKSYWCPTACALGALVWTTIGIWQIAFSLFNGVLLPVWGGFELLGGIGFAVATAQRSFDLFPA